MRISSARLVTVSSLLFSFLTSRADASESGKAQIRSLICSQSNTCTAYFGAHEVAAGSTCVVQTGGAVRWDASTPAGANMLAVITAAHLANYPVKVWDDGCLGNYPKLTDVEVF